MNWPQVVDHAIHGVVCLGLVALVVWGAVKMWHDM